MLSLAYSYAVEANYASHGTLRNVLIVQGDIYKMPFWRAYADRLFCFGVLQHTPDPRRAFLSLPRHVRPGGEIVADVYLKSFLTVLLHSKYWVRPFTHPMDSERLYSHVQRYVDAMWPLATLIRRIPRVGASINWRLLVAGYSEASVMDSRLKEWAYLDTYDMLAPLYDHPQTLETVEKWLEEARLEDARASYGFNGIELRGKLPLTVSREPKLRLPSAQVKLGRRFQIGAALIVTSHHC